MPIELQRRRPPSELYPSQALVALVKHFEGYVGYAYDDRERRYPKTPITAANAHTVKGRLTIGYGRAVGVKPGDTCTHQQAEAWLIEDLEKHAQIVRDKVKVPLTQGEFDATTDLAYNTGRVPPSMLACFNGGVTDKGKVMEPKSYGSALLEFPRNCRWGGIPHEEIYRRRLADACVFSDLPWESACSKNIVRLVADGSAIDPALTTSLEDTLERARQDVPMVRPPIDVTKPWPVPPRRDVEAPPAPLPDSLPGPSFEGIPTQLPLPSPVEDEDELFSDTPAAAEETSGAKGAAPSPATQPEVARAPSQPDSNPANKDQPRVSAEAAPATAPPSPPAPPVPLPPKLPDPPIPIGQQTSAVESAKKSEDWSVSAKAMWQSRRFWGLVLVMGGRLWMLKTGSNAVLGAVSDPLVTEMFSGFMVMLIGEIIQHWGERKATRPLR